jgi:hypothetical protein
MYLYSESCHQNKTKQAETEIQCSMHCVADVNYVHALVNYETSGINAGGPTMSYD